MKIKGGWDRTLLWTLGALVSFGLLMLLSASGPFGYQKFNDTMYFFKHQLLFGLLPGLVLFFIFAKLDYRRLVKFAPLVMIFSIILLVLVYVPGIGMHFGGSNRWVNFGFFSFQPSELVKIGFLIYISAWLEKRSEDNDVTTIEKGLIPFLLSLGVIMFLLVMQPNTGSMAVIVLSSLVVYFIAGAPLSWFAGLGFSGIVLLALLVTSSPYRARRVEVFLHPTLDPKGLGYHINQAYLAIGSGGVLGLGYGHSRQKWLYLPEVYGDSIFAIIAEEMGFVITALFLIVLGYFVYRCFVIARNAPDKFGRFLAVGIGSWIGIQSFLNIASMLGIAPMTGVTLPFVSYGSSAFVALSIASGIMLSISRNSKV